MKIVVAAVLAVCALGGVAAPDAAAASGDLTQKPGLAGCWSTSPSCSAGRGLDGAASVAVSPDGRSTYVASRDSGAVAVFDRAADGTLTQKPGPAGCASETGAGPCADGTGLLGAASVTVSPDGRSAYVASSTSAAVAVFDRAPDGTLTQKPGPAGCASETGAGPCADGAALDGAASVTVSPDGASLYVASPASGAVAVFDRAADGTLTQKPGSAGCVSETGAGPCADGTALLGAASATVSPDGRSAYVAAASSDAVAVFSRAADGTLTQAPGTTGCISDADTATPGCAIGTALVGAASVTVSPDGASAYVAARTSNAVAVFARATDGTLTQRAAAAGCVSEGGAAPCADGVALTFAVSVTVSPDGANAYVAAQVSDAVAVFARAGGALTQGTGTTGCVSDASAGPCADGTGLDGAASVTVSPDGRSAYVASQGSDAVAVFDRAPVTPMPAIAFVGCPSQAGRLMLGDARSQMLNGTPGADRIFAGAGNDTVDSLAGDDCVDLDAGNDRGEGGSGRDLVLGGLGGDRISGSAGNDNLDGGAGGDRLFGGTGNDRVHGKAGGDRIEGGRGSDKINGGNANDSIVGDSSADTIAGDQGSDRINGGSSNDSIRGDSGNDRLTGGSGRDRITGGPGNDIVAARDGQRDRIDCGLGRDRVTADRIDTVARDCERVSRR